MSKNEASLCINNQYIVVNVTSVAIYPRQHSDLLLVTDKSDYIIVDYFQDVKKCLKSGSPVNVFQVSIHFLSEILIKKNKTLLIYFNWLN